MRKAALDVGRSLMRSPPAGALAAVLLSGGSLLGSAACLRAHSTPARGPELKSPAPHRDIVATESSLFSHSDEEIVIRDFFQDMRHGVFLDVGCGHPVQDSNTYYLEKFLGWSGIGVDALPEMAEKWRHKRPASRFFNFIVTDHGGAAESFYRAALWDISSLQKTSEMPGHRDVPFEEIRVPATMLTSLLDAAGVAKIDLMSMDIEGAEPKALAGFDIERFKPRLVCIEAKPATRSAISVYFAAHHYARIERYVDYDVVNYYFTPIAADR